MAKARSGNNARRISRRSLGNVRAKLKHSPRSLGSSKRKKKIAVIGVGHMGRALVEGFLLGGIPAKSIIVADHTLQKTRSLSKRGVEIAANAWYPTRWGDFIFLAVKPSSVEYALDKMRPYLKNKVLVSLVAGLTIKKLQRLSGKGSKVVRIMPNLPVQYGVGVVGVFFSYNLSRTDRNQLKTILAGLGVVVEVKQESDLETITVLSGSGPGVVSYLIDALARFGAREGLSKKTAEKLTRETFKGTAVYLEKSNISASSVQKAVATKGGVTEAILREFKEEHVQLKLITGMKQGVKKIRTTRRN